LRVCRNPGRSGGAACASQEPMPVVDVAALRILFRGRRELLLGAPVAPTAHRSRSARSPDVLPQHPQRFRKSNTVKARGVAVMPQRELFPRLRMRSARMPASDRACGDAEFFPSRLS